MKKIVAALLVVALSAVCAQAQNSAVIEGKVALTDIPAGFSTNGVDIKSAAGNLVPVEGGAAAPFLFLLSNTANNVSYASLPLATALPEGTWTSGAGYNGDPAGDLAVSYATATGSVGAPVVGNPVIPEPATGLLTAFGALGLLGFRRRR